MRSLYLFQNYQARKLYSLPRPTHGLKEIAPPKISRNRGFSLIELMVSIAILTTGIIFVVEIFTTMLNASTKGADWSVATYIAAANLEQMLYDPRKLNFIVQNSRDRPYIGPPIHYNPGSFEPRLVASVNNTTYYIAYLARPISQTEPRARALYIVQDQVVWFIGSKGYGHLSSSLNRLIYVH